MDTNSIGSAIAQFRKKAGLTQAELAAKLHLSDKAVSRWENGLGYPEITQFPALAAIFGITVDRLMMGKRNPEILTAYLEKEVDPYVHTGNKGLDKDYIHRVKVSKALKQLQKDWQKQVSLTPKNISSES